LPLFLYYHSYNIFIYTLSLHDALPISIYDLFNIESTSPNVISEAIDNANGEDIEVIINSGGGDLFSGSDIFSKLKEYPGNVEARITGVAASASSIVSMVYEQENISQTESLML